MEQITVTLAMLEGISREARSLNANGYQLRDIIIRPENGTTALVTLDAGYGTYSFHVNRNGRTWRAGLGIGAALVGPEHG